MILLVPAMKSAEASITSMAIPRDFLAQIMQVRKQQAKTPKTIAPIRRYFYYSSASFEAAARDLASC